MYEISIIGASDSRELNNKDMCNNINCPWKKAGNCDIENNKNYQIKNNCYCEYIGQSIKVNDLSHYVLYLSRIATVYKSAYRTNKNNVIKILKDEFSIKMDKILRAYSPFEITEYPNGMLIPCAKLKDLNGETCEKHIFYNCKVYRMFSPLDTEYFEKYGLKSKWKKLLLDYYGFNDTEPLRTKEGENFYNTHKASEVLIKFEPSDEINKLIDKFYKYPNIIFFGEFKGKRNIQNLFNIFRKNYEESSGKYDIIIKQMKESPLKQYPELNLEV